MVDHEIRARAGAEPMRHGDTGNRAGGRRSHPPPVGLPAPGTDMTGDGPVHVPGPVRGALAVMRHEVRLAFHSPMSYVLALGFALSLGIAIFVVGEFLSTDEASMRLFVLFLPWTAIVFVPALAMRAWSAGPDDRGLEFAMSLPVGDGALVAGKFLAGLVVLAFVLLLTAAFPATVAWLGEPDYGAMAGAWLAGFALLAAFYAVALAAAAVTADATAAFVTGASVLFGLAVLGSEGAARRLDDWLSPWIVDAVASIGPRRWIEELSSGRVGAGSLAYFGIVLVLALAIARGLLAARRRAAPARAMALRGAAAAVVLAAALGVGPGLVDRWSGFIDLSEEREHTLAPGTRAILQTLPPGVTATLFWSADQTGIPATIRTHARRAGAMLDAFARASGGRLAVRRRDPLPDSETEIAALGAGMRRIPMTSGDAFFLGVEFRRGAAPRHGDRALPLPYLDVERARLLEYDLASALSLLGRERPPRVAVLSPLVAPSAARAGREGLSFLAELRASGDLAVVPYFADTLPDGLDVLVAIDATLLKRSMLRSIDRFVAGGGALIVLLDPFVRSNPASRQAPRPAPSEDLDDVTDLLAAYGIRFTADEVAGDAERAAPVSIGGSGATGYPFWIQVPEAGLAASHPVTGALRSLLFAEPGGLGIDAARGVVPLVTTSAHAGVLPRERFPGAPAEALAAEFAPGGGARVLAAYASGPFPSAVSGDPGAEEARVFAVADVDWIFDPFSVEIADAAGRTLVRPINDNHAFLANMVAFGSGAAPLAEIRSRGRLRRPFTRVEALFRAGEEDVREELAELARTIAEGERHIEALIAASGASSPERLRGEVAETVTEIRRRLLPLRRRERAIREQVRAGVDALQTRLLVLNFTAPVVLAASLAGVVAWRRRRAPGHGRGGPAHSLRG